MLRSIRARGAFLRARPVLAGVAAIGLALTAVGCGQEPQASPAAADAGQGRSADPGNPATWVLPLQAYMPDPEQEDLLFAAVEDAKADCMKRFGFAYRPAEPFPDFGPDTLTDLRYGIHDRKVAATYGYKPAGDMSAYQKETRRLMAASELSPAEEAVMTGRKNAAAGRTPEDGCAGEAHRKVYGTASPVSTIAMDLANQAYVKAQQAESVRNVFRAWSQCMAKRGYAYDKPLDAPDDPAFGAPKAGAQEIATALADLDCRARHKVAEVWFDEESALQRQSAEQHVQELKEAGHVLDEALKAAARTTASAS